MVPISNFLVQVTRTTNNFEFFVNYMATFGANRPTMKEVKVWFHDRHQLISDSPICDQAALKIMNKTFRLNSFDSKDDLEARYFFQLH